MRSDSRQTAARRWNLHQPPEAAEESPDADAQVHTHESLGFDPIKRCRLPKCKLMKKVGQPTCGPHRKQTEESSCNELGIMCFKCERITALITESLCPLPTNSLLAEHAYQVDCHRQRAECGLHMLCCFQFGVFCAWIGLYVAYRLLKNKHDEMDGKMSGPLTGKILHSLRGFWRIGLSNAVSHVQVPSHHHLIQVCLKRLIGRFSSMTLSRRFSRWTTSHLLFGE